MAPRYDNIIEILKHYAQDTLLGLMERYWVSKSYVFTLSPPLFFSSPPRVLLLLRALFFLVWSSYLNYSTRVVFVFLTTGTHQPLPIGVFFWTWFVRLCMQSYLPCK